ncbi:MAG: DUF6565 domain-containing protein [Chlorobiaceae bacterium]
MRNSNLKLINNFTNALIILLLSSCNVFYSKDKYINDFQVFVDKVEQNYQEYTEADWVSTDKEYEKYTVEYYNKYKAELTEKDKYALGKIKGAYNVLKLKKEVKKVFDQTKEVLDQAKGFIDGSVEKLNK